ncbi:hypothetical protein IT397_03110 [Candidatus Nomurabacteria bacterium]|nr:hypothetical protein [Candidatus Nomurabacteria bacterium]
MKYPNIQLGTVEAVRNKLGGEEGVERFLRSDAVIQFTDPRFTLATQFDVVVPSGYNHATRLAEFKKAHEKEFYYYNGDITDKNYAKATTKLVPGRKFKVKVFQITKRVSSEDCLAFLKSQKAVLVGAQGATLAYEQGKDKLPMSRWSVSFDEKDTLWLDADGYRRVPFVYRHSDGDFYLDLGYFVDDWYGAYCLLCFCDSE